MAHYKQRLPEKVLPCLGVLQQGGLTMAEKEYIEREALVEQLKKRRLRLRMAVDYFMRSRRRRCACSSRVLGQREIRCIDTLALFRLRKVLFP